MPKYKITASKSQKKYSFVVNAENEKLAKERIHNEGYSILSVEIFDENNIKRNTFVFEAEKNGEIKKGKVVGNDIFKIYLKLRDGIGYKVLKLFPKQEEEKDENYKYNLIKEIEEQYIFYKKNLSKKTNKKKEKPKEQDKNEINSDGFYLQKELEETYKLIDYVLEKTRKLFEKEKLNISEEKKEKLRKLHNSLIKIKSSTNIIKLKEIGEKVLEKVGEIELENIEKEKNEEAKFFLNETNSLLKKIGSNKKFITKEDDIVGKIKALIYDFFKILKGEKRKEKKKTTNNQGSYSSLKTKILLNKYKDKLTQNFIESLKFFYVYIIPISTYEDKKIKLQIKRQVIKQNIYLLKNKLEGKSFSYTKALKGFDYILENIFIFFVFIRDYLFFVVLFYSLSFLVFQNLNFYGIINFENGINYRGIFYFLMFVFVYFAIYFSRGIKTLFFNFFLLFFIFSIGIINF